MSESSAIDLVFASLGDPESTSETDPPIRKAVTPEQPMPTDSGEHLEEQTASKEDSHVAYGELHKLLESLRSGAIKTQFQQILDRLVGSSFGTYETNALVVESINSLGAALGVKFRSSDGQTVRLRCVNPPRSKEGSFQLRTADRGQKTLYSGVEIPPLQIAD